MRILHVIPTLAAAYGGPTKACREMAASMVTRGHRVEIWTTSYEGAGHHGVPAPAPALPAVDGVWIRSYPIDGPLPYFRYSRLLARSLRDEIARFDVVHIHSLYFFTTMAAGYYAKRAGVPYILRPHGTLNPYIHPRHRLRKAVIEQLYHNRLFRGAAAVHYTTAEERDQAQPWVFGRPGFVLPLGLRLDDYDPLPARGSFRARHQELQDKRLLLFLGRVNFKKGLDILADAFGRICRLRDDVELVIAGPDNDAFRPQVETWLREAGVLERTTFTGMLTGDDKLAVLRDADLFVLPSYTENFGIAVIEAMACRLPVLISDSVNIWPTVEGHGAGAVEPCDAGRFAARALTMLGDPAALARCGEAGHATVRRLFDWTELAAGLEAAYQAVIEGRLTPDAARPTPRLSDVPGLGVRTESPPVPAGHPAHRSH